MKILHLHLCYEYFDSIKRGDKDEEYRLSSKWKKKLDGREFTHIRLYRAYQKVSNETVIDLPYKGYKEKLITHKHFDNKEVAVCAIPVDIKDRVSL